VPYLYSEYCIFFNFDEGLLQDREQHLAKVRFSTYLWETRNILEFINPQVHGSGLQLEHRSEITTPTRTPPIPAGTNLRVYPRHVSILILEAAAHIYHLSSNTFESSCVYINIQHMSNNLVSLLCSSVLGAVLGDCALFDQRYAFFFGTSFEGVSSSTP
jgi:hypothetical protein